LKAQLEYLFHEVVELPEEDRARFLDERQVHGQTRMQLEELLAFDTLTSGDLQRDISHVADRMLSGPEATGTTCGAYRLGELLGRGGMASVYLADRVDGEVSQRVAVKLIHVGMDDPVIRQHFFMERQILAGIAHPNIARLLDVGHNWSGQPYLVMEYIEGLRLDAWAEGVNVRERVALFLKVCSAVGYLHRNLVVHRDLKPENILVTAAGEPKILDFGIAKILDVPSESAVTRLRILTPEYASPEQFAGRQVSTLTDVYSLGAVLYRILAGKTPHAFDGVSGTTTTSDSCGRFTRAAILAPEMKGDLEFILQKAMRPEPQDRYATVEQFAEDLEDYLDCRPIRSRTSEQWYRARKLLRRHWLLAILAAIAAISLAAGFIVANHARSIAEHRFAQLRQLSDRVIDVDRAIRTLPGSIDARRRLVSASLEYLEGLSRDAAGDPALALELADGYWRMARIQGVNAEFNMGQTDQAEASLINAQRLTDSVLDTRPHDRNALFRSALIEHDRMIVADTAGRHEDALMHAHNAAERLDSLLDQKMEGPPVRLEGFLRSGNEQHAQSSGAALLYSNIALAYVNQHRYDDAVRIATRAAGLVDQIPQSADIEGQALSVLANALRYQGDLDGALAAIKRAEKVTEHATYPSETSRFFNRYALIHREGLILGEADSVNLERPEEAIRLLNQALNMAEAAAEQDVHDSATRGRVITTVREMGSILSDRDPARAVATFDIGLHLFDQSGARTGRPTDQAVLLAKSSYPLRRLGRFAEAKKRVDEAFAILRDEKKYPAARVEPGGDVWAVMSSRADYESQAGDARRALKTWNELLDAVTAAKPDAVNDLRDAPKLSYVYLAIEELSARTGDRDAAEQMRAREKELWARWQQRLPHNNYVRHQFEHASH
jgi:serine/threonine protein kinase